MYKFILVFTTFLFSNLFAIDAPTLKTPSDGSVGLYTTSSLQCYIVNGITDYNNYTFELDTVPTFDSPMYSSSAGSYYSSSYGGYIGKSNFDATSLHYGVTYYWRVKATDGTQTSAWSQVRSFTTINGITNDYPTNGITGLYTSHSIICDIEQNNTTAANYEFEMDTTPNFDSPLHELTEGSYFSGSWIYKTNSNLLYGTTYYWRARVHNGADTSAWASVWNFTTQNYITLDYPANNQTGLYTSRSIVCDIEESNTTASNYEFEMDTTPNFDSPLHELTEGSYFSGSWIYKTNSNLLYGTTYYWRARVRNDVDTSAWTSVWNFTTKDYITLDYPNNNSTNVSVDQSIICDIEESNTSATNYEFELDTTPNFDSPFLVSSQGSYFSGSWIYKNNSGMRYGQDYYWRARVRNAADTSNWSVTWTFKTEYELTTAPSLLLPTDNSTDVSYSSFLIDWDAISNVDSYQYQISTTNDFTSIIRSGNTSLTDKTITSLTPNTLYYWRVRGENVNGYSPWSTLWSFTTETAVMVAPTLISPANNSTDISYASVSFSWNSTFGASEYIFEISQDNTFSTGVTTQNIAGTTNTLSGLNENTQYFWRVASTDGVTTSSWSTVWNFTTENPTLITDINKSLIKIHPNPAQNYIVIQVSKLKIMNIEVLDMTGKVLINISDYSNQSRVDISNLQNGIYFVRIGNVINKFIKK